MLAGALGHEHAGRVGEAGHFAINAGASRRAVIEFRDRSSRLPITLPTSRLIHVPPSVSSASASKSAVASSFALPWRAVSPAVRRAAALTSSFAVLVMIAAMPAHNALAQTAKPKPIDPTTSVSAKPLGESAEADNASASSADSGFDGRQKALNKRTEANDYRYGVAQHDCYSTFFVNHCLDKARDQMRVEQRSIRTEQLALDDEQRVQHAKERDQQAAVKRAQYEADAPQRGANEKANETSFAEKQRQNELAAAQRNAEAPQRAANEAAYQRKQADYQKQLDEARARGAQDARDREAKADRYAEKQRQAELHKTEVEARQKEAAAKQQQKALEAQQEQQRQQQLKQQQQQQQPQQQNK
ncbi:lipoprotein [Caballeronia telluris]|uniref:Lipoprotein n=1 Tax=Caballeronia telluris TaxID=326475 RepID=A0A158HG62_9BURK|nr:lipoprotein [Caballeronia telluris]